jgi:transglutaminase-like putative cysteine protease
MESANREKGILILPFVVLIYLETLRRATFYAFGWAGNGQALAVISFLVTVYICLDYFYPSKKMKGLVWVAGIVYLALVWMFNNSLQQGELSFLGQMFLGLPNFGLSSVSAFQYATFSFFVVLLYGLAVFLITGFILERKSVVELFFAGILLLGVEIIASDSGIAVYVVLNIVSSIVLKAQTHLLKQQDDYRVRKPKGSGLVLSLSTGISFGLAVVIVVIALSLPAGKAKVDLSSGGYNLFGQVPANQETSAGSDLDVFWKGMQEFKIKGNILLKDKPVMYVKSPEMSYWRGESADYYTGNGWSTSINPSKLETARIDNPFGQSVPVKEGEQAYLLSTGMSSDVIFYAGAPAAIKLKEGTVSMDEGGNIYTDKPQPGVTYCVISYFPELNQETLKRTGQEYPFGIRIKYLQLPDNLPERVRTLAIKLTNRANNPYDKVKIIEDYLHRNYSYDLTINPAERGRDITDYFLFDLKKGYCTYHSTAMVVMLRSIGIPARWVKGFRTGSFDQQSGVYEVNMTDAHAWTEAYFADYGWVPFEPTASFAMPGALPSPNQPVSVPQPVSKTEAKKESPDKPLEDSSPEEIINRPDEGIPWGTVIPLCFILSVGLTGLYLWKKKNVLSLGTGSKMRDIYFSFIKLLSTKGYPKDAAQTPMEYAGILTSAFPGEYKEILCITNGYTKDKYDVEKLSAAEVEVIQNTWKSLSEKWTK